MLGTFILIIGSILLFLLHLFFAVEIATAYFLLPLGDISPENIAEYFGSNVLSIGILSAVGTVLSVGFLGSLYLAFNSKSSASELEPMSALLAGVQKFFPLFGAYFLSIFAVFFGLLLLILPGIYLGARLALFPAFIMLEGKGVIDSLKLSWEKTDEHGGILFRLNITFCINNCNTIINIFFIIRSRHCPVINIRYFRIRHNCSMGLCLLQSLSVSKKSIKISTSYVFYLS
jgi:hypothetical protein